MSLAAPPRSGRGSEWVESSRYSCPSLGPCDPLTAIRPPLQPAPSPSGPCWAHLPVVFPWLVRPETEQAPHLLVLGQAGTVVLGKAVTRGTGCGKPTFLTSGSRVCKTGLRLGVGQLICPQLPVTVTVSSCL